MSSLRNLGQIALAACVTALAGCGGNWSDGARGLFTKEDVHALANKPLPVTERGVTVSGATKNLGESSQAAATPDQLLIQLADLVARQQFSAVRRTVQRYPDVAVETLRAATSEQAAQPAHQALAAAYDALAGQQAGAGSWQAYFQTRATNPQQFAEYDATRRRLHEHWKQGQFREGVALKIESYATAGSEPLLMIDAYHLAGTAHLLNDNAAGAAGLFAQAAAFAGNQHAHQAIQIALMQSEAERRAEQFDKAAATWLAATTRATQLLAGPTPVVDPVLWERIAYLRPVKTPWPQATTTTLANLAPPHGLAMFGPRASLPGASASPLSDEGTLWAQIGHWRLVRDEGQAALLAFKQAEAAASSDLWRERMQLESARALVRMGQMQAATANLVRLSGKPSSPWSRSAMAMFGTLRLAAGSTKQGLSVLRKAVEESPPPQWLGQGSAEADLGLAYLMNGDEPTGLRWLHSAQQRFAAERDDEQLLSALTNEALFFEKKERPEQLAAVRARMETLER